ncbi:hypothetical protein RND81_10G090200 [Saponaria officinalis]|uniref:Uncharacterized protein n=1 Tax=Saponaria officinalis TaxID=3572 RepID=A0AAW1I2M1_SAPOF
MTNDIKLNKYFGSSTTLGGSSTTPYSADGGSSTTVGSSSTTQASAINALIDPINVEMRQKFLRLVDKGLPGLAMLHYLEINGKPVPLMGRVVFWLKRSGFTRDQLDDPVKLATRDLFGTLVSPFKTLDFSKVGPDGFITFDSALREQE